ncbi:PREDICTED: uncharacterized protein LOC106819049, partial [Priapulus caudatus]|uniref:Uncharacterized protein LOC106819049 n=1 Tax=Priapulus caudatus TaxID=37621 RepID=A0ABM1F425_PRICU
MTRSCKKVRPAPPRLPLLLALVSCTVLAVRSVGMPDVGGYLTDESTPSKRNGAWFTRRSAPSYPDDESALLAMVHEGMSGAEEFLSDDPIHSKRNGAWFTKKSDQTHIGRTSQLMDVVNK